VLNSSDRLRLTDGVNQCREAVTILTAAVGSLSQVEDGQLQQLALATRDAVGRLEERLQLLADAYRIADQHRAADLLAAEPPAVEPPAVEMAEPVVAGVGTNLSQVGVEPPSEATYFLEGS
jgi:hypothetical protein